MLCSVSRPSDGGGFVQNYPVIRAFNWINLDLDPNSITDLLYNLGKELISPSQLSHP